MNKVKKTAVFLVIGGIILIAAAVVLQLFTPAGAFHKSALRETEYFDSVREIIVVSGTLPINLEYTDEEQCEVSWLSELPLIVSCDEQGTLRITQDDSFTLSLFSFTTDYHISVKVPRRSYRRVNLASSSGKITARAVSCESFEASTKNGNIEVFGADERTKIKTGSGEIDLHLTSLNGDMTINGGEGDVNIYLPRSIPFFMEFSTDSGSCTTQNFADDITDRKGDAALLNGKGGIDLKIKTTSGDLNLIGDIKAPLPE